VVVAVAVTGERGVSVKIGIEIIVDEMVVQVFSPRNGRLIETSHKARVVELAKRTVGGNRGDI
jgi:hypothetical protein